MRLRAILIMVMGVVSITQVASADTILFRNGAVLEGRLLGTNDTHVRFESNGNVGNYSRDDVVAIDIGELTETTPPPKPEPSDLDKPTAWQEGDPDPYETTVPEVEPEQQSEEAPPSQPVEDECGEPPTVQHVWVTGYWWWGPPGYLWVPGYWVIPPYPAYVYVPGYWYWGPGYWVYTRGGWAHHHDHIIVMYAHPRPHVWVHVYPRPPRIVERRAEWRQHHYRHTGHEAYVNKTSHRYKNSMKRRSPNNRAKTRYDKRVNSRQNKRGLPSTSKSKRSSSVRRASAPRKPRQTVEGSPAPKPSKTKKARANKAKSGNSKSKPTVKRSTSTSRSRPSRSRSNSTRRAPSSRRRK